MPSPYRPPAQKAKLKRAAEKAKASKNKMKELKARPSTKTGMLGIKKPKK